jgi:hypothetical protein
MARSKLAAVGKGQSIKRDSNGALTASAADISTSFRTLVTKRYLTQAEAEAVRSAGAVCSWAHEQPSIAPEGDGDGLGEVIATHAMSAEFDWPPAERSVRF